MTHERYLLVACLFLGTSSCADRIEGSATPTAADAHDTGPYQSGTTDAPTTGDSDATADSGTGVPAETAMYFPPPETDEWETVDAAELGWEPDGLAAVVSFVAEHNSTGFLILHRGRIVSETYWQGWDKHSSGVIFSATKTVIAVLLGLQLEQGLVGSLDDPIAEYLGPGWVGDADPTCASYPYAGDITIRQAITMTSGLRESIVLEFIRCKFHKAPDSEWFYNTMVYRMANDIIDARAPEQGLAGYSKAALFDKIGMQDTSWPTIYRAKSSVRDMARFGLLLLNNGDWDGQAVVEDKSYLAAMLGAANPYNPAYGYLTWLNGAADYLLPYDKDTHAGPIFPNAPADTFAALGADDKKIHIVPSHDLVVVRHGGAAYDGGLAATELDNQLWTLLCPAISCTPAVAP